MAALTDEVKMFIVQCLACYDTPSQVAESVKEQFDITVERQNVMRYDPTKISGRALSQKHKDIFEATRKAFLEESLEIPIASKIFRLRALQRSHSYFVSKKNFVAANQVLEQAAKEVGDFYNGRNKVLESPENPLIALYQQIKGTSIPITHDVEGEIIQQAPQEVVNAEPEQPAPKPKRKTIMSRD